MHDKDEDKLGLPKGKYDVPLALSSKQYNPDGTLFDPIVETVSLYGDVGISISDSVSTWLTLMSGHPRQWPALAILQR